MAGGSWKITGRLLCPRDYMHKKMQKTMLGFEKKTPKKKLTWHTETKNLQLIMFSGPVSTKEAGWQWGWFNFPGGGLCGRLGK